MNFLLRSNSQHVNTEKIPPVNDVTLDYRSSWKPLNATTLDDHVSQDFVSYSASSEAQDTWDNGTSENGYLMDTNQKNDSQVSMESHLDVREEEGWIIIPEGKLPENWRCTSNTESLQSFDRPFVFPGEQVYILACLKANKWDTEIITPFKVAALMSKNGTGNNSEKKSVNDEKPLVNSGSPFSEMRTESTSESIIRMENHKRQTETLLQRFKNSHFFVRIAEADEPLWSKRSTSISQSTYSNHSFSNRDGIAVEKELSCGNLSGGAASGSFNCCSLPNGDILVMLQVTITPNSMNDPAIEILQFEKHRTENSLSETCSKSDTTKYDPCGDLLKWLLPLGNVIPPPARPLSPPQATSSAGAATPLQRPISGSQLLSHLRSYSMSSLPHSTPPHNPAKIQNPKPTMDLEDWDPSSSHKFIKNQQSVDDGLLSYRSVTLERERFSVCCGLEGIYVPGRKWRRKLKIIQPLSIRSFDSDCNSTDFLCVQIQNTYQEDTKDIIVYIDAVTVVLEASKGDPPLNLPIACVEAGNEHSLPNLALRSGEEHSFILKPVYSVWKNVKVKGEKISPSSSLRIPQHNSNERKEREDKYSIIVSFRSNYSSSSLFFKQSTTWRPRLSRDIKISVVSDVSGDSLEPKEGISRLPVQVITLQASNLTNEDLTMTVLAPASFTPSSSLGLMTSSPTTPMSPFVVLSDSSSKDAKQRESVDKKPESFNDSQSCSHLWLQSRVPLGCVPAQSTATIKLELLPLTNGIISLNTLQIEVKERDLTYVPECPLQINATSSISSDVS